MMSIAQAFHLSYIVNLCVKGVVSIFQQKHLWRSMPKLCIQMEKSVMWVIQKDSQSIILEKSHDIAEELTYNADQSINGETATTGGVKILNILENIFVSFGIVILLMGDQLFPLMLNSWRA